MLTTRETTCLVVALAYTVFVLLTTLLFYHYRDDIGIRHRSVRLTVLSGIVNVPLTITLLCWTPMNSSMPGWAVLWLLSVLVPIWVLLTFSRFIRLVFFYRISEAKLLASEQSPIPVGFPLGYLAAERNTTAASSVRSATNLIGRDASDARNARADTPPAALDVEQGLTPEQLLQRNWFHRNRRRITSALYMQAVGLCMMLHVAVTVIVSAIYECVGPIALMLPIRERCFALLPLEVLCTVWYGLLFFFLREQTKIRDTHGIHLECKLWLPISSALYIAFLATSWAIPAPVISEQEQAPPPPPLFPPAAYAAAHFMCGHCIFVLWPALRVFSARLQQRMSSCSTAKQDQERSAFDQMLNDPGRFKKFKAFCVTDFSVENALFLERYRHFKQLVEAKDQAGSWSYGSSNASKIIEKGVAFFTGGASPRMSARSTASESITSEMLPPAEMPLSGEALRELKAIYTTFIVADSEFEVNLTSACRQAIATRICHGTACADVLDSAEREIYQLVYLSTYPRYLQYKKRRVSAASTLAAGSRISQHIGL
ncbi:hypothetical protein SYNPS1DRAFT_22435 [Syncephalis pseudoplumigaleata]|uniref:RGS domain-containing protein n=1 Tax=Syncephalis pseudoplumigaleata TaxID=1712513 RepID=A0A4P9Z2F2_9FUNG|nr:hypothetical protein SYNPS1DRAFT_22435 [Syncephalis pseudoplumigaleata]|eukprot:RKP25640.1 hypothetical protein SYNPS1DRAFT_22435 [Syncephalis pseudoplumigaleata]